MAPTDPQPTHHRPTTPLTERYWPKLWVFNSVGNLGHDADGNGGRPGRITVQYHFTQPGPGITLFGRTMTIEAYKDSPLPDGMFRIVNPANIDKYHAAIARELDAVPEAVPVGS